MKKIVDVVNFNCDASCLSSQLWLDIMQGASESILLNWLKLYIRYHKPVTFGFTGATIADIAKHNPEAIDLINSRPDIFEIILRPFTHDSSLLRSSDGFLLNFEYGRDAIHKEFNNVTPYFLPPEFMLTNQHIMLLYEKKVVGVFINPSRFSEDVKERIPSFSYVVKGLFDTELNCIPFHGHLTEEYLYSLHHYDSTRWNDSILHAQADLLFTWRDGESSFFLPDGLRRESVWLNKEDQTIQRVHLKNLELDFTHYRQLEKPLYQSYPVHPFTPWMRELKLLGFIGTIRRIEESINQLSEKQIHKWLLLINSDILSAVEKRPPVVKLKKSPESHNYFEYTIYRTERWYEGEEYLAILEADLKGTPLPDSLFVLGAPHITKWRTRVDFLENLKSTKAEKEKLADQPH